jgi:hypothetical protein
MNKQYTKYGTTVFFQIQLVSFKIVRWGFVIHAIDSSEEGIHLVSQRRMEMENKGLEYMLTRAQWANKSTCLIGWNITIINLFRIQSSNGFAPEILVLIILDQLGVRLNTD